MATFIPNSTNMRVGTLSSPKGNATSTYNFDPEFEAGAELVIIPSVMTRNGGNIPNLRILTYDNTGFTYQFDELMASKVNLTDKNGTTTFYDEVRSKLTDNGNPYHTNETIGFVAFCIND